MVRILLLLVLLLILVEPAAAQARKKLLLLAQGPDGHPPKTHEYVAGQQILKEMLDGFDGLDVTLVKADSPWSEGPGLLAKADGAVLFLAEGARWIGENPKRLAAFQELARRKGGLTVLHWAMGTRDAKHIDAFVELFGACHGGPDRKYKVLATQASLPNADHPIARGLKPFMARDEFYYSLKLVKVPDVVIPILKVDIDGRDEIVCWTFNRKGGGRSFGFSGLHFHENWDMPEYRRLVLQGVLWTMNVDTGKSGVEEKRLTPK